MQTKKRVLIVVEGGNADYVCDPGVIVEKFDRDDYADDPENTGRVPAEFADLAETAGVPHDDPISEPQPEEPDAIEAGENAGVGTSGSPVVAVTDDASSQAVIGPWDSRRYGHADNPQGPDFEVDILDHRKKQGQVYVDIRPDGGNVDDLLSAMVEVTKHPDHEMQAVPVVRVYRGDECVASVYADGPDKALLVLSESDLQAGILRIKKH